MTEDEDVDLQALRVALNDLREQRVKLEGEISLVTAIISLRRHIIYAGVQKTKTEGRPNG